MRHLLLLLILAAGGIVGWFLLSDPGGESRVSPPVEEVAGDAGARSLVEASETGEGRQAVATDETPLVETALEADETRDATEDGFLVRLLDAHGDPITDRHVEVHWRKGWGDYGDDIGVTDARGEYRSTVRRLDQLQWIVAGEQGPQQLGFYHPFDPHPLRPREVEVIVPPTGRLLGQVVDAAGQGVREVLVGRDQLETLGFEPWRHLLTEWDDPEPVEVDDEGRFELELFEGFHRFEITSEVHAPMHEIAVEVVRDRETHVVFLVECTEGRMDVLVSVPAKISGIPTVRLRHEGALPSGGAPVLEATPVTTSFPGEWIEAEQQTHRYSLPCPRERAGWILSASVRGCRSQAIPLARTAATPEIHLAALPPPTPPRFLRGRVVDPSGAGLVGQLYLNRDEELRTTSIDGRQEGDGSFSIKVRDQGMFYLRVQKEGYERVAVGPIDLAAPLPELEIVLRPARAIEGVCRDARGRPVACSVSLYRSRSMLRIPNGAHPGISDGYFTYAFPGDRRSTREDGAFRFEGVPDREVDIWILPKDRTLPPARVTARGGDRLEVTLGEGLEELREIEGVVLDGISGAPIAEAVVEARAHAPDHYLRGATVVTGSDGHFHLRALEPATVAVTARAYGFVTSPEIIDLRQEGDVWRELHMLPGRTLAVRVHDSAGRPFRGEISVRDSQGRILNTVDAYWNDNGIVEYLDRTGRAMLRGLPPQPLILLVGWSGKFGCVKHAPPDPEGVDAAAGPFEVEVNLAGPQIGLLDIVLP